MSNLVKFVPSTTVPADFRVEGEEFKVVRWGEYSIPYTNVYKISITESKSTKMPNPKEHLGQFYIEDYALDDPEEAFFDQLNLMVVAALPSKRFYRAGKYIPGGKNMPDCYSDDGGIRPSDKAMDPQADFCAECPVGETMWKTYTKTGEAPLCKEGAPVIFFDIDNRIFVMFYFNGTKMRDWRKLKGEIEAKIKAAFIRGKTLSDYVVTLQTEEKDGYFGLNAEFKPMPEKNPGQYFPIIDWFMKEQLPLFLNRGSAPIQAEEAEVVKSTLSEGGDQGWFDASASENTDDIPF